MQFSPACDKTDSGPHLVILHSIKLCEFNKCKVENATNFKVMLKLVKYLVLTKYHQARKSIRRPHTSFS